MNERMMAIRVPGGSRNGLVAAAEVGGNYLARALLQVESALYDGRCREEEVRVGQEEPVWRVEAENARVDGLTEVGREGSRCWHRTHGWTMAS